MNDKLIITVVIFALVLFFFVFQLLRKGRIPVKYALVWLFAVIIIFITSIIPDLM